MSTLNIQRDWVMVDVACNDPDNGIFAHVAEQIQIGAELLELEPRRMPPRFVEIDGGFRLAGKVWPVKGSKDWVGNWCWNGYWMEIPKLVEFLDWLHGRRLFDCTCGEERIYNIWKNEKPFDKSDRDFLSRMLGKPSSFHP